MEFVILFGVIWVFITAIKQKQKEEKELEGQKKKENREFVVSEFLKEVNFVASKSIYLNFENEWNCFLLDDVHKQFGVLRYCKGVEEKKENKEWNCKAYGTLLNFDVKECGVSVLPGKGGNAAVGATLGGLTGIGGVTGAIIGSVTGSERINEECSSLTISIIVNDFKNPLISIDCLAGKIYKKDSLEYKETIKTVNEIIAVLTYIQANKEAVPKLTVSDNDVIKQENNEHQNVDIQQRICGNCGSILDVDSVFCGNCGKKYEGGV